METIINDIRYQEVLGEMYVVGFIRGSVIKEVCIPEAVNELPVTKIAPDAFKGTAIKELWLPCTITEICSHAFENCLWLEEVNIGSSNGNELHIHHNAFKNCPELMYFDACGRPTIVDSYAFTHCSKLKDLDIMATKISAYAFYECNDLHDLCLGNDAMLLGYCLDGCPIEKLCAIGNASFTPETLDYFTKRNAKIYCTKTSNLQDLAYSGYPVEIYSDDIDDILLMN